MAIIVANAASSITTDGSVPNSSNRWVWIGLRTGITASGSATWYQTNASTSGCELMAIAAACGKNLLFGPFNSPCGLSVTGISTASALLWIKTGQG